MKKLLAIIAICAVLLAVNTFWVDSQTRAAAPRDGGNIVSTGVVPANVKVEGTGPTIVLVHGFGGALDWWDDIAPSLASDHRVIRIDLMGHGGTDAPRSGYTIARQAQLVSEVLDKLGVEHFTLIGHSMGGEVATALAELNPARIERMVLIDSPPVVGTKFSLLARAYFTPVIGELLHHFSSDRILRQGLQQGFAPGFPVPDKFVADFRQLTYDAAREAHDDSEAYRAAKPTNERLAALNPVPPLLVIFGTEDAIVPPEHAKYFEQVPDSKVVMIEGAGHSPMVETPQKVLDLIRGFERLANGS